MTLQTFTSYVHTTLLVSFLFLFLIPADPVGAKIPRLVTLYAFWISLLGTAVLFLTWVMG